MVGLCQQWQHISNRDIYFLYPHTALLLLILQVLLFRRHLTLCVREAWSHIPLVSVMRMGTWPKVTDIIEHHLFTWNNLFRDWPVTLCRWKLGAIVRFKKSINLGFLWSFSLAKWRTLPAENKGQPTKQTMIKIHRDERHIGSLGVMI